MLIGLVGKPSSGKSTFFRAATLAEAEIAPYPFTTIRPNRGFCYVKIKCVESEFGVKCNPQHGFCINGWRFVPMEMLDVAGLVPGAHLGKGKGNAFLDDLRQADVLIHVVDASGSTNELGEMVPIGAHDPLKDVKFLEEEIDLWFLGILKKGWDKFSRQVSSEAKDADKAIAGQFAGLKINLDAVRSAMIKLNLRDKKLEVWTENDLRKFASELRRYGKPIIIAANKIDVSTGKKNYERLKKEFKDYVVISCSAESELALREAAKSGLIDYIPGESDFKILKLEKLNEKQKKALEFIRNFLKEWKSTGVQDCLNTAVLDFLKCIVIFPGGVSKLADTKGNILPDAFILPPESTALDFANKIHSDLAAGFIKAIDVRTKKAVGKDHKLKHRDIIEIVSKK